jgi:hypothetical protein
MRASSHPYWKLRRLLKIGRMNTTNFDRRIHQNIDLEHQRLYKPVKVEILTQKVAQPTEAAHGYE